MKHFDKFSEHIVREWVKVFKEHQKKHIPIAFAKIELHVFYTRKERETLFKKCPELLEFYL